MRINPCFLFAILVVVATGCKSSGSGGANGEGASTPTLTKLGIEDPVVGKGDAVEAGDEVWVVYTGKLGTGHIFDSNDKPDGKSFHVTVGSGGVIKGWDQGLVGMKQGGKRKLSIPFALAYGDSGKDQIPPKSDLFFDIELKTLLKRKDANVITAEDVKIGTGKEAKDNDNVAVSYTVTTNGQQIEKQDSVKFKIGGDQMQIDGFDKAVKGMKVGGERDISIPPMLTRGLRNEDLGMSVGVWHVKLLSVN